MLDDWECVKDLAESWLYTTEIDIKDFYYTIGRYYDLTVSSIAHGCKWLWNSFWSLDAWIRDLTFGIFGFSVGLFSSFAIGCVLGLIGVGISKAIQSFSTSEETNDEWIPITDANVQDYYVKSQSDKKKPQRYRVAKQYRSWAGKDASSQMSSTVARLRNISRNLRFAKFTNADGWSVEGRILFGDCTQFVVSSHIPRSISNVKSITIYDEMESGVERILTNDAFVLTYPDVDRDFALVCIRGLPINNVKDITKSFSTEHYKYTSGTMQLLREL
jgi:hypothetical protein